MLALAMPDHAGVWLSVPGLLRLLVEEGIEGEEKDRSVIVWKVCEIWEYRSMEDRSVERV